MELTGNLHSPATAPTILLTPICSSLTVNLVSYMRYNATGKELYRDAQYIFRRHAPVAGETYGLVGNEDLYDSERWHIAISSAAE